MNKLLRRQFNDFKAGLEKNVLLQKTLLGINITDRKI